jgi:hypothetical protein
MADIDPSAVLQVCYGLPLFFTENLYVMVDRNRSYWTIIIVHLPYFKWYSCSLAVKECYIAWYPFKLPAQHYVFVSHRTKIAEFDETNKGQTKKHYSVACQGDNEANDHRSKSLSKISECTEGPDGSTTWRTSIIKAVCHQCRNEKCLPYSPEQSHNNEHGKSLWKGEYDNTYHSCTDEWQNDFSLTVGVHNPPSQGSTRDHHYRGKWQTWQSKRPRTRETREWNPGWTSSLRYFEKYFLHCPWHFSVIRGRRSCQLLGPSSDYGHFSPHRH